MALGFKVFGLHQITIGLTVALIGFVVGSLAGKPSDEKKLAIFFG
jgi:sodium/pantothenate symporter